VAATGVDAPTAAAAIHSRLRCFLTSKQVECRSIASGLRDKTLRATLHVLA
jgi:hypothetical protein